MAAKSDDETESLKTLFEKELRCAVCLEHYTEPKVIPCLHYFCKKCIIKMASNRNPFDCPHCSKVTKITIGKEDQLPTVAFINRLEDIHGIHKNVTSKKLQCGLCSNSKSKANVFCGRCNSFICKSCAIPHSRIRVEEEHQVISLKEVRSMTLPELVSATSLTPKCSSHTEPLNLYCSDCKKIICRDCAITDHSDHKRTSSNLAVKEQKAKLKVKLKPLEIIATDLNTAVRDVEDTEQEIEDQGQQVYRAIETSFKRVQDLLQQQKVRLIEEARGIVNSKKSNLRAQKEDLDKYKAQTLSVVGYTQNCIQYSSDSDLMREHEDIIARIQHEVDNHHRAKRYMRPLEEVDIRCDSKNDNELKELCDSVAEMSFVRFKIECLDDLQQTGTPRILVSLANGNKLKRDPTVEVKLVNLEERSTAVNVEVERVELGLYQINMPKHLNVGRYELIVTIKKKGRTVGEKTFEIS